MKVKISKIILRHRIYSKDQYCRSLLLLIFINDLPNDIKSEIELFADDAKLFARPLSKEMTKIDLNKLSYWEDIWKLKANLEKY